MKSILSSATAVTLFLAPAVLAPTFAFAENYALLIGASTYENLDERYWLRGPANDVDLVSKFLLSNPAVPFQADHVTILADGIEGKTAPTLAAIRTAFGDLADTVAPGDFVYLHFSGHGSQAPALDPASELDGLDELFLPVDIGPWEDSIGTVQNALVDDEIGALIDNIRTKGADVWVVFDSCHSGTATRAAPTDDDVRMRKLDSSALGVPEAALAQAESYSRALPDPTTRPDAPLVAQEGAEMGSLTAFFAAQTDEVTPEKNMPKGKAGRRLQGVFTYTLFETLAERPNLTYRQLGQEILRKYAVKNLARSTPMFEGALDDHVFAQGGGNRILQWTVQESKGKVSVNAGSLHGLVEGSELLLLSSPADTNDAALATFRVTSSTTFQAKLEAVGTAPDIPRGAVLRKLNDVIDFSMNIALPPMDNPAAEKLARAITEMQRLQLVGERVSFVAAGQPADLRLAILPDSPRPDAIWFLPGSGLIDLKNLDSIPSISTGDKTVEALAEAAAENIGAIGKVINLMKVGAASGQGKPLPVTVSLSKSKFDPDAEEIVENSRSLIDAVKTPRLIPNDVIGMNIENNAEYPVDYNILYVGSDYSVSFIDNGRLLPNGKLQDDFILVTDEAFGKDRVIVILAPAGEQADVQDLSFLEQGPLERTRGTERAGFAGLLDEAGFGQTTRAAVRLSSRKKTSAPAPSIFQFDVETTRAGL